jgi:hypothetical protein
MPSMAQELALSAEKELIETLTYTLFGDVEKITVLVEVHTEELSVAYDLLLGWLVLFVVEVRCVKSLLLWVYH